MLDVRLRDPVRNSCGNVRIGGTIAYLENIGIRKTGDAKPIENNWCGSDFRDSCGRHRTGVNLTFALQQIVFLRKRPDNGIALHQSNLRGEKCFSLSDLTDGRGLGILADEVFGSSAIDIKGRGGFIQRSQTSAHQCRCHHNENYKTRHSEAMSPQ